MLYNFVEFAILKGWKDMEKVFLFDFDGTLVTDDILDVICDIVEKKKNLKKLMKKS